MMDSVNENIISMLENFLEKKMLLDPTLWIQRSYLTKLCKNEYFVHGG